MENRKAWATVALLGSILLCAASAAALPETSLNSCQNAVRVQGKVFLQNYVNAVGKCLQRVSTEVVKKNATDVSSAANSCIAQFRKINDTRGEGKSLEEKLRAKIEKKCMPGGSNTHTLADILGTGAGVSEPLEVESIGGWCHNFGGDGSIDSLTEWIDCLVNAHTCKARQAIVEQFPRVLEYLEEVKLEMAATTPPATDPTRVTDALAGLDAADAAIEGGTDDNVPELTCGSTGSGGGSFPATGQTTSYGTGSDGDVQAGAPLNYVDNGDGTITDLNTGLMWEKKSYDGSIHDKDVTWTWCQDYPPNGVCDNGLGPADGTLWVLVSELNFEEFAGYTDWRIPNIKELQSIVNYKYTSGPPLVSSEFNTGCVPGCTVTTCSCATSGYYWSSTSGTFDDYAWTVPFLNGVTTADTKAHDYPARAVRGP